VYSEDDSDDVNRNGKVLGYGCGKTGSMVGAYALIVARRAPPRLRLSPIPRCPNEAPDPRRVLPFMPRELPLAPDYWHAIFFSNIALHPSLHVLPLQLFTPSDRNTTDIISLVCPQSQPHSGTINHSVILDTCHDVYFVSRNELCL
jgi:hypothetical protein